MLREWEGYAVRGDVSRQASGVVGSVPPPIPATPLVGRGVRHLPRISVEVPLRGVEAISEGVPILPELVRISFRRPTEFANKVVFTPKLRFFIRVSPHPIVNELRQLVSEARVQH